MLAAVFLLTHGAATAGGDARTVSTARTPAGGASRAIGTYGAGCLAGATRLPRRGPGFRIMQPERRRYFAHAELAAFLQELGAEVVSRGLGVLPLGDLSQPRGGPAP